VLVLAKGSSVVGLVASGSALRSGVLGESIASNHAWGGSYVMSAGLECVGSARGTLSNISVVTTGDNTSLGEPVPGAGRLTAVAAHRQGALETSAARNGILRSEQLGVVASLDAISVVKCFRRAECPARSAGRLVSDVTDYVGALGEGGSNIKVSGEGGTSTNVGRVELLSGLAVLWVAGHPSTHHALNLSNGLRLEADWHSCLPGRSSSVDGVDKINSNRGTAIIIDVRGGSHADEEGNE